MTIGQATVDMDQPQRVQVIADRSPVRRTEAVNHQTVSVQQQGRRAVGAAVAGRGDIGPQAALVKISSQGGDNGVQSHGSDRAQGSKARRALSSDDHMVMDRQVEEARRVHDLARHLDICWRWARVARRVVVHQDQGAG